MSEEKLYPPIIDNSISAFELGTPMPVRFYFNSDSQGHSLQSVSVKITLGGEKFIEKEALINPVYNSLEIVPSILGNKDFYEIQIDENFSINKPYIVQLRAIGENGGFSEWSEGVVKYALAPLTFDVYGGLTYEQSLQTSLPSPSLKLSNDSQNEVSSTNKIYRLRGVLSFEASSDSNIIEEDVLNWWQVTLIKDSQQVYTSEKRYPDRYWDNTNRIAQLEIDLSGYRENTTLSLIVLFATTKGYIGTKEYKLKIVQAEDAVNNSVIVSNFQIEENSTLGGGRLSAKIKNTNTSNDIVGTWQVLRSNAFQRDKLEYQVIYEKSDIIRRNNELLFSYLDISLEAGIPYQYQIKFRIDSENSETITYAKNEESAINNKLIAVDLEDIYLSTKDTVLRIKYDPMLTNYKRNVVDVITPTLGGEYPFVRRNGQQKYRSFTIGGLISYHANDIDNFSKNAILAYDSCLNTTPEIEDIATISPSTKLTLVDLVEEEFNYLTNSTFSSQTQEWIKEKTFRDKVLDFLYSDNAFLFRSFAEGNIFIRLSDISLTSNKTLGRNIYSFSATATEVMAPSAENYKSFFSDLYTSTNFILKHIYINGVYSNGEVRLKERDDLNDSGTLTLTSVNSTVQYKIAANNEDGFDWTNEISLENTYLDCYGRVIPVINGTFYPGFFPEIQIIEDEPEEIPVKVNTRSLNMYEKGIEF